ncbi:hypothetical protein ACFE04_017855 [Oxalis oulophora]
MRKEKAAAVATAIAMISLDEYMDLFLSNHFHHLTLTSLNQIINFHGFKKIHKTPKKVLIDALETIQLMDPSRSTLHEPISPGQPMPAEDILADLNTLNWQECHVSSVQVVNASVFETGFSIEPKLKKGRKGVKNINGKRVTDACDWNVRKKKRYLVSKKKRGIDGYDLAELKWKVVPRKKRTGWIPDSST